jgi:hypothetical protein
MTGGYLLGLQVYVQLFVKVTHKVDEEYKAKIHSLGKIRKHELKVYHQYVNARSNTHIGTTVVYERSKDHSGQWFGTLPTMAVLAPSLAACMHWLAPFPPKPVKNLWPWMVSPALGSLGA